MPASRPPFTTVTPHQIWDRETSITVIRTSEATAIVVKAVTRKGRAGVELEGFTRIATGWKPSGRGMVIPVEQVQVLLAALPEAVAVAEGMPGVRRQG